MDLSLTWRGDYVMRSATELARRHGDGEWQKAEDLAHATDTPAGYIRQILRLLVQADLAEARSGTQGGYRLKRDPAAISLLEVVEIAEGPLRSRRCVMRGSACTPGAPCGIHSAMWAAQEAFREQLRGVTLHDVVAGHAIPGAKSAS